VDDLAVDDGLAAEAATCWEVHQAACTTQRLSVTDTTTLVSLQRPARFVADCLRAARI
jgi:hypothetical protein